jgi:hypothetical protein
VANLFLAMLNGLGAGAMGFGDSNATLADQHV